MASIFSLMPLAALADHTFRITNRGEHAIYSVYISAPNYSWGSDLLPSREVIYPNQYQDFNISQGCLEDILIVYNDNQTTTNRNFDTCQYGLITHY